MSAVSAGAVWVATLEDVPDDRFLIVDVEGTEVGVIRDGDELFAMRNLCPHHGAPLCRGRVTGTMLPSAPGDLAYGMDRRVVSCPWHQYEFDLRSGRPIFTNVRGRARTYSVSVVDDDVYVALDRPTKPRSTP